MKQKNIYIITAAILLFATISCKGKGLNPVRRLDVKETKIYETLSVICEKGFCKSNENIILLRVKMKNDSCFLRTGPFHKDDITKYLRSKNDTLVGFFEYDNKTVFVFGEYDSNIFNWTSELKTFEFLNIPAPKLKKGVPEIVIEPLTWTYIYINGEFKTESFFEYPILE
jgi:hypothetical protein